MYYVHFNLIFYFCKYFFKIFDKVIILNKHIFFIVIYLIDKINENFLI